MRTIEPRHDDSPRLCTTCGAQEVAFANGDLCVEHWLTELVSQKKYTEAYEVASAEGYEPCYVHAMIAREQEQRERSAPSKSGVHWIDLGEAVSVGLDGEVLRVGT